MNITLKLKDVGFRRSDMSNDVQITGFSSGNSPLQLFSFTVDRVALSKFVEGDNGIANSSSLQEATMLGKSA